jgi:uncharacterized SAM-binding protein YcdF (DUF218 family)
MKKIRFRNSCSRVIRLTSFILIIGLSIICFSLIHNLIDAQRNSSQPVDAYLVLGGSITREIHVAQLATINPTIPILISQGSKDPCILLIFQRAKATLDNTWLEKCAKSTFDNFIFSVPILKKWGIKKAQLITSDTHLPRAGIMARVAFISQGIAINIDGVEEIDGIPANYESDLKTVLDVVRMVGWSMVSQVYQPSCGEVTRLSDVDLNHWHEMGFGCERRGGLPH